ncbi:hypothetical protein [Nitrosomonas communis]|uniref:Uncharacterized protein n=1 Tax=Nitrosomonas communis TaxID=44574 RepID=A0A1I4XK71_9PROT|nr:hypothetical protein [Nitrosomonas communis]SFN26234.1 hypothetical protein SAMN05421863_11622 [Nitrosomonas communis]
MTDQKQNKDARLKAGLFIIQAVKLKGVEEATWQRWEEQTGKKAEIPSYCWELFFLKIGQHPKFRLGRKNGHKESIE